MSDILDTQDAAAEALLGELVDEFVERLGRGERPDVEEYARRSPKLAAVLRHMLPALQVIHLSAPDYPRAADDPAEIEPEGPLGDFRIVRKIGRGGMGVVYEAVQISLGRRVALKVLPFAAALDARQLQRFKTEAQAAAHLHHQHIVPVYAVGCERGVHYYAMQFIDGQNLAELIRERAGGANEPPEDQEKSGRLRPPPAETGPLAALSTQRTSASDGYYRTAAGLALQAAEALEHAHQLGVVHRDVKPANLILDARGHLWVTDFGLARLQSEAGLTASGDLLGTLRYMSPEQALGYPAAVDHRTDVYSLGATLYELLALRPVFDGRSRQELLRRIASEEPTTLRRLNPAVPVEMETIVHKALEKEPRARYATAQELADDLRRYLEDKPIRARRPSWLERARKWARRHRPAVWSAAAALLVVLAATAGSVGWVVRDRAARQAKAAADLQAAADEAQRSWREGRWPQAQAAAKRAEALLADGAAEPALAGRVQGLLRELAEEEADRRLVARIEEIRLLQAETDAKANRFVLEKTLPEYREAFRVYGLRAETVTPDEAAALLRRRPAAVRATLLAALDHWLILARHKKAPEAGWLERVLSAADADPWRQGVRAARGRNDRQALEKLANEVDVAAQPPEVLFVLDLSLRQRGARETAVAMLRRAQEAFPGDFWINHNLGVALHVCRPPQIEEAIRYMTAAVALRPQSAGARLNLGLALLDHDRPDEAAAAFRKAIDLKPDYTMAHFELGNALWKKGRLDEASAAYRRAIAVRPDFAEPHCHLGLILRQQGEFALSLAALQQGHELGSRSPFWRNPSARWVSDGQRLVELDGRLPAVLRGEAQPADAEWNAFAEVCHYKKLYVASAQLRFRALSADPIGADALKAGHRYDGACAAALAGCGHGEDASQLDDKGRAHWRKQAVEWLRADLTAYGNLLEGGGPEDLRLVRQRLRHWQRDPDLAGVRDPAALARLPADERQACERLWAEVRVLLARVDAGG